MKKKRAEITLVILKPDAIRRMLAASIIARFEKSGLKILALKRVRPTEGLLNRFFPKNKQRLIELGEKCVIGCLQAGLKPLRELGSEDPLIIGEMVNRWNVEFYLSGSVIPILLSGENAIQRVRDLVGHTDPTQAKPGTIRGDFSLGHSIAYYNMRGTACRNLVHASGNAAEAEKEMRVWFSRREILIAKIKKFFM